MCIQTCIRPPLHNRLFRNSLLPEKGLHDPAQTTRPRPHGEVVHTFFQISQHLTAGLIPPVRVFCQGLVQYIADLFREVVYRCRRVKTAFSDLGKDFHGISLEHPLPGYQFVQKNPRGEDIRAMINLAAVCLFRGHISHFSLYCADLCERAPGGRLCDTEIHNLNFAVIRYQNILRRNIPVNQVEGTTVQVFQAVGIVEPGTDKRDHVKFVIQVQYVVFYFGLVHDLPQILSEQVLHGDKIIALDISEVINLDNIFMIEQRRQLCLYDKTVDQLFFPGKMRKYHLDGDQFFKPFHPGQLALVQLGPAP